nr:hypothetical protein CFP56_62720 [Quercus suber]
MTITDRDVSMRTRSDQTYIHSSQPYWDDLRRRHLHDSVSATSEAHSLTGGKQIPVSCIISLTARRKPRCQIGLMLREPVHTVSHSHAPGNSFVVDAP